MALLLMAVWDTEENNRTDYTSLTLASLFETVDFDRHRLVVIDNGSCDATVNLLSMFDFDVITLPENIGQARALNKGLLLREPGEFVVRLDNDVVVNQGDWVEDMEYVIEKDPSVALVALKRTSAWEHPDNPIPAFRSRLEMLPRNLPCLDRKEPLNVDEPWMTIEVAKSVLGTCQGLNPAFLDKVGFFYQLGSLWGFIDPILCAKAHALGYKTVYIPHVGIDYLEKRFDSEGKETPYQLWKMQLARRFFPRFEEEKARILASGDVYHGPEVP